MAIRIDRQEGKEVGRYCRWKTKVFVQTRGESACY